MNERVVLAVVWSSVQPYLRVGEERVPRAEAGKRARGELAHMWCVCATTALFEFLASR